METKETTLPLLTLGDLWRILQDCWKQMLILALAASVGLFLVNRLLPARYASTATLYVLGQSGEERPLTEDFSLALNVVTDCGHLLQSRSVLTEVIDTLGLDMTYHSLSRQITTYNPEGTRILEVTAQAATPTRAKEIVDAVCTIGSEKINAAMGTSQVNLYEEGLWDHIPCNRVSAAHCALAFVLTALAVYGAYVLAFLLKAELPRTKTLVAVARTAGKGK